MVNGRCAGWMRGRVGDWGDECSANGEDGERLLSKLYQHLLENIDRKSCNNGSRKLIPVFNNPHRKSRPSSSAVARTLEYLVGLLSRAASSGRKKEQVRIHIRKTREYLECSNQVSPQSSPLQGMKAQPPYHGMKTGFKRSWKERLIMKINSSALFEASMH